MLKSARMRKVWMMVPEEHVDSIMQGIASFGEFEPIEEVEAFGLGREVRQEQSEKAAELLRRINHTIDLLGVEEPKTTALSFRESADERVEVRPSRIPEILEHIESEVSDIEPLATVAGKIHSLLERRAAIKAELASADILRGAGLGPKDLAGGAYVKMKVGLVSTGELASLESESEGLKCALSSKRLDKREAVVAIAFLEEDSQEIDKMLSGHGFEELQKPARDVSEIKKELSSVEKELSILQRRVENLRKKHGYNLLALREIAENCDYMLKGIGSLPKGRFFYLLRGWVPAKMICELRERTEGVTKSYVLIESEPGKADDVPTKLDNRSVFKPFEEITRMFGLPHYSEMDPTVIMAFTFPVLFGLMFGDVGHGAIIVIAGLLLTQLKNNKVLKDFGVIILFCGISAMFFGVMYGNVFGIEGEILKPTWVNPSHEPKVFLMYAIIVGVIQLSAGVILDMGNKLMEREYKHLLVPIGKISLFWAGLGLVFTHGSKFAEWASSPFMYPVIAGIAALMISSPLEMRRPVTVRKLALSLLKGFFEVYESIMRFLSNTISYARIFALALVHAGLSLALFKIAGLIGDALFGIPKILILIVGTVAIVGLEGVMVFLHAMRLHYYEWFDKFFSAKGRDFLPLKLKQTYTNLKETK